MSPFKPQERIHLPWQTAAGAPIEGTVTAVEPARFMITWDTDRKPGQSRVRYWYPASMAPRFRHGNAAS